MMNHLKRMETYFEPLNDYPYSNNVSVKEACWVCFTVPHGLEEVFEKIAEDAYLSYESKDVYGFGTEYSYQTIDDDLNELQHDLCKEKLPHSVRVENSSDWDHWERADYRYINGEYLRHVVGHGTETLTIHWLNRLLKDQAFVAIQVEVEERVLRQNQPEFAEDEIVQYKTNQLRSIING